MDNKKLYFELLYNNKKLTDVEYNNSTTIKQIIKWISDKYKTSDSNIKLFYNKKCISHCHNDPISNILITQLTQLPNSRIKVQVMPQIILENLQIKERFFQIGNETNSFEISLDLFSKFSSAKAEIFDYFQKIFSEFNQQISNANYLISSENDDIDESLIDEKFLFELFPFTEVKSFYFLIKNQSICFYSRYNKINDQMLSNKVEKVPIVGMFKLPNKDECFKIITQTYNKVIKEIEVYNSMKIGELKDKIQEKFYVSKQYQELTYLFYRLDDDNLTIADFKMKKNSTVYLRGFFFPLIFCDYYTKKISQIYINIASLISEIIQLIIDKFKLNCEIDSIQLLCNGKILDNERYLIDYNIQKNQTIYFK